MLDYPTAKAKEGGGDEEREELDDQRELLQEIRSVEEVLWFAGEVDLCVDLGNGKKGTGNRGEEERSAAQPDVEKQKYLKGRLCLRLELGHLARELFHQGGAIEESDPLDTDHPQPNQKSWIFEDEDISGEEEDHGGAEGDAAKDVDDENFAATPITLALRRNIFLATAPDFLYLLGIFVLSEVWDITPYVEIYEREGYHSLLLIWPQSTKAG